MTEIFQKQSMFLKFSLIKFSIRLTAFSWLKTIVQTIVFFNKAFFGKLKSFWKALKRAKIIMEDNKDL